MLLFGIAGFLGCMMSAMYFWDRSGYLFIASLALGFLILRYSFQRFASGRAGAAQTSASLPVVKPSFSYPPKPDAAETKSAPAPSAPSAETVSAPAQINGVPCLYQYKKVYYVPSDPHQEPLVGSQIDFIEKYGRISIYCSGSPVGELKPGRIQQMIADWLRRGDPMWAMIVYADDEKKEAAFDVYLYRDELKLLLQRSPDARKYRLTGTGSEEMQLRASDCKPGAKCAVEYDGEKGKYAVLDGWEIGYLPAAAARIVEEAGEDRAKIYIAETQINDDFKTEIYVYVFS